MMISEVFAMGSSCGGREDSCSSGCSSGCEDRRRAFEFFHEPRFSRTGLAAILGSSSDGTGVLGIFSRSDR